MTAPAEPSAKRPPRFGRKAAVLALTRAWAQELGPKGIRIASVSPGPVTTDLWLGEDGVAASVGRATGVDAESVREQTIAGIPSGRFTTAGINPVANGIVGEMTGSRVTLVLMSNQLAQDTLDVFTGEISSDGRTLAGVFRTQGNSQFTYVKR